MKSITYIGMDVHTTNYTLCCYSVEGEHESSKFWLNVLNELKSRGVMNVYLFCTDGLPLCQQLQSVPKLGTTPVLRNKKVAVVGGGQQISTKTYYRWERKILDLAGKQLMRRVTAAR